MRTALLLGATALSVALAAPAQAAFTDNGNGTYTTSGTSGGAVVINFNGLTDGPTLIPGLTAVLTLTFNSVTNGGLTYNFGYSLFNSSSTPITGSRVSSFGFNTDPNVTGGSSTGAFTTLHTGDSYPIIADPEVCVFAPNGPGGVCTGSGGGVDKGQTGTGTLSLNFASAPGTITLSSFVDRYQSISGAGNVTSAVGVRVPGVPEPATWAMMLLGFGFLGVAMRRKKDTAVHGRIRFA